METKKVAKEYMQKDILRTIFQMRKRQEDDKQIKRIIVLDYDLTEYHWKTNIKKLQEEGFLKTDSDAKIPALTESGTEYARQLQRAAEGWNQFLQMSGVNEKCRLPHALEEVETGKVSDVVFLLHHRDRKREKSSY